MRLVGTLVLIYGLALTVYGDTGTGFVVAFVGWCIRRYYRPQPTCHDLRRRDYHL